MYTPTCAFQDKNKASPPIWECWEKRTYSSTTFITWESWILHFPKQFQMASQARERHNSCKMICIPASLTIPLFLLYTLWIPALLVCLPRIAGIRNGIIRLYTSSSFIRCLHCFEGFFCQTIESLQRKQEEKKQNIGRRRRKCQWN